MHRFMVLAPEEKTSKTRHTIRMGGQEIKYTATAGTRAEDAGEA